MTLQEIIATLMTDTKGILAADESPTSAGKRLAAIDVPSTEETRRQYRELFLGADGVEGYLSGVILHEETLRQKDSNGVPFADVLEQKGILPGIKVDKGLVALQGHDGEQVTQGLDGLAERLAVYYSQGARFAKWRAVFVVGQETPSDADVLADSVAMARYAQLCQEAGIVPIVEPEVLYDGAHSIEDAEQVTTHVLTELFATLKEFSLDLSGVILKTSMVLAGKQSEIQSRHEEVAEATVRTLRAAVPEDLGGVVFLSGGQTPEQATDNFNAIAQLEPLPWKLAFSFARAIQQPVLDVWRGKAENVAKAREVLLEVLATEQKADQGLLDG